MLEASRRGWSSLLCPACKHPEASCWTLWVMGYSEDVIKLLLLLIYHFSRNKFSVGPDRALYDSFSATCIKGSRINVAKRILCHCPIGLTSGTTPAKKFTFACVLPRCFSQESI